MDFDSVAERLYETDPSDFVAARRSAVASAKQAGDTALAKELGGLRKPTTTGWVLNLLVRAEPEGIDRLLELGAELRSAQQALRVDELRSLTTRRAAVLTTLTDRAATAARERGHELSETVLREVSQSLAAALADTDIGADLRHGRMLAAVSYSGFGPAALAAVPLPPAAPESAENERQAREESPREADENARRDAREAARRGARARVAEAERAVRGSASDLEVATEEVEAATRRVEELRTELTRAEQEMRFAAAALGAAEETARRDAAELKRAREAAAE